MPLSAEQQKVLLALAQQSLKSGLSQAGAAKIKIQDYDNELQKVAASFVTLHINGNLRGCVGRLEASRPLVEDISENAYGAGFEDSRFSPLQDNELSLLDIHISILTTPQKLQVKDEKDLFKKLRPGLDGLVLREGGRRSTFLPSVWDSLPDVEEFVAALKHKGGWSKNYWSSKILVQTYQVEEFGEET
jgi:AmmeMemoRadiSam system protein A